jgi:uncharacterized membrane protein YuzA (DUF378 family)
MKSKSCIIDMIAWILILIGGINWGLVGFFDFNLVTYIFGDMSTASRAIYAVVGLAALYGLIFISRKHYCKKEGSCS